MIPAALPDGLALRRALGREEWAVPQPFPSEDQHHGWVFKGRARRGESIIVSVAPFPDASGRYHEWLHASIARVELPTYDDLIMLHRAVFGDRYAYQVFAPPSEHVNIHARALHLWGRVDGVAVTPQAAVLSNGARTV